MEHIRWGVQSRVYKRTRGQQLTVDTKARSTVLIIAKCSSYAHNKWHACRISGKNGWKNSEQVSVRSKQKIWTTVCKDWIKGGEPQAEEENLDVFSESQLPSRLKHDGPSVMLFPCVQTMIAQNRTRLCNGQWAYLSVTVQIERDYSYRTSTVSWCPLSR
jgi:hypothetical protein